MITLSQSIDGFYSAMVEHGFPMEDHPIADGVRHRFYVDGDKPGSKNGFYVLHGDGIPAGYFGTWKDGGDVQTWCAKRYKDMSPQEQEDYCQQQEQIKKEQATRQQHKRVKHEAVAISCNRRWRSAEPAYFNHPYLLAKQVRAYGIRQLGEDLLIPVRDVDGRIMSLQIITRTGFKLFEKGGRVAGGYHSIGSYLRGMLYICEGYATGASIHVSTGHCVAVAFNAGNLMEVARILAEKYPDVRIIIAADNDQDKKINTGLIKGREVADRLGLNLVYPKFDIGSGYSDFNDYCTLVGVHETKIELDWRQ